MTGRKDTGKESQVTFNTKGREKINKAYQTQAKEESQPLESEKLKSC